ncbi:hypothetical protein A3B18_03195 [Candidatus Giovannonibacteria bacterium RIFCSPLOWO2_01_FULL_46_13]|uniref:Uncharacterized protein n=1 Tax=Candidatus Giovannonibacteria bacterium RIFCSPLOWO2_01_FULL_46_13 TaxID=1798352 RepID=A0A1F5X337_9BACT|nr:MAG: hypothetical protein A3B18_03195 [Candidatus Giovannonibacteria bacterium RIFCSPLOWO2_01_FULL_46_13]
MVLEQQALLLAESRLFFFDLKELFCACSARSNLYSAKEKLKIVSVRGEGRIPFELFLEYSAK